MNTSITSTFRIANVKSSRIFAQVSKSLLAKDNCSDWASFSLTPVTNSEQATTPAVAQSHPSRQEISPVATDPYAELAPSVSWGFGSSVMAKVTGRRVAVTPARRAIVELMALSAGVPLDRKSTRLNSSHW